MSAPYREPLSDTRLPPRTMASGSTRPERTSPDLFPHPGPSSRLRPQPSLNSLSGSLRNVPSTTSLRTLDRRQLSPATTTAMGASDLPGPNEGISRMMILNRARSSKRSVFLSDQEVPQGHQMAPHVIRRLEDYFLKDSDPSIAVVEHLASNLGVETSDIHVGCSLQVLYVNYCTNCAGLVSPPSRAREDEYEPPKPQNHRKPALSLARWRPHDSPRPSSQTPRDLPIQGHPSRRPTVVDRV